MRLTALGFALPAALMLTAGFGLPAAAGTSATRNLTVGGLTLHACGARGAFCGSLVRPLDPQGQIPGELSIGFEYYPHTGTGPRAGVLVATEGGPGYAARESRDDYLALYAPLRDTRDVLIMDNRGTGSSGPVDCPDLQQVRGRLTSEMIAACGAKLGSSAWLYGTVYVADDLAALLEALDIGRVDLYGDSYGTYTAQTFAIRHPARVRTIVLDGAYPLSGAEVAWYPHYAPAMRERFTTVCSRSPACRSIPGTTLEHLAPALAKLRSSPQDIEAPDGEGRVIRIHADATALATLMFSGAPARVGLRELDAAARAYADGDAAPLARLLAEAQSAVEPRDTPYDPRAYSLGLAAAVMCGDAPQVFDMTLPVADRLAQRDRVVAQRSREQPGAYAPFTWDEYRGIPLDYEFIDECVHWPPVDPARRAVLVTPPSVRYPDVPVLVLSGELDGMTPVADGADAASAFPGARHVVIRNGLHVNALPRARSTCGARIVRDFIATGEVHDDCSERTAPVRPVARFARRSAELDLSPLSGTAPRDAADRALTAATIATLADVATHAHDNGASHGVGLRGGSYDVTSRGAQLSIRLRAVRWSDDVAVSGVMRVRENDGHVEADVSARSPRAHGNFQVAWTDLAEFPRASCRGSTARGAVAMTLPAP